MKSLFATYLLMMISGFICTVRCQTTTVRAISLCSQAPDNRLKFTLKAYEESGSALSVAALNATEGQINTCIITGAGTLMSPFSVESYVDLNTNIETNPCGMITAQFSGNTFYKWKVRVDRGLNRQGIIIEANCSKDNIQNGEVETLTKFNISSMSIVPRFPANSTGPDSYATGSELTLRAIVYPNGLQTPTALKDVKGIYLTNCYSGTNEAVTENRNQFINIGCPVDGATYSPSNPPQTIDIQGDTPYIVEASYFTAATIANRSKICVTCGIGKCSVTPDPACQNRCDVSRNSDLTSPSGVDSGETFTTCFNVQDVPVQDLFATTTTNDVRLDSVNVNTEIQLTAKFSPNGLVGTNPSVTAALRGASGFFLYGCSYADNLDFNNPVLFIDGLGCPVGSGILSAADGFELTSVSNNVYTLQTGIVTLQQVPTYTRVWARCNVGICPQSPHGYCSKRCGAANTNDGAQQLGYTGLMFSLAILNTTIQPAVSIDVIGADGRLIGGNTVVTVNTPLDFQITVVPGGQGAGGGNTFDNAKGIFVGNCYASTSPNPTQAEKNYFIGEFGCRNESSPYRTTQNCLMDSTFSGVPPLTLDCGTFAPPEVGTIYTNCDIIGLCPDENNPICLDRCAQGQVINDPNVQILGVSFSRVTQVEALDLDRTAIRSNEIVTTIIAVTVVVPLVVLCATAVVVYFIVNSQRPK